MQLDRSNLSVFVSDRNLTWLFSSLNTTYTRQVPAPELAHPPSVHKVVELPFRLEALVMVLVSADIVRLAVPETSVAVVEIDEGRAVLRDDV